MGGFRTQHGSALNIALALHSRPFFTARAERVRFQPEGYLYLAEDRAVAAELAARAEFQCGLGLPIEHPEPESKVPFLVGDGYLATNFCALDGLYLPALVHRALIEEAHSWGHLAGHWTGRYEVTFDHHALVGATERPGVWACCGFSGHGVMQSPAVGEALAAMILGETPPLDIGALSPLRTEPLIDRTQL